MEKRRCPECGYLTSGSKCPICMVHIPGSASPSREVNAPPKQTYTPPRQTGTYPQPRRTSSRTNKSGKTLTVILLVLFLLPFLLTVFLRMTSLARIDEIGSFADDIFYEVPEDEWSVSVDPESWSGNLSDIKEAVICDTYGITVAVHEMQSLYGDPIITVTVTNDSEQNVSVAADSLSVNGFILSDSIFFCETESGETVEDFFRFDADELALLGIDTIANVEFSLRLYDSDTYETIDQTELLRIETSDADYVQTVDIEGEEIYSDGGLRLLYLDAMISENGYGEIRLFAEQAGDSELVLYCDEVQINGEPADGFFCAPLRGGTRTIGSLNLYELGDVGVETTDDLEQVTMILQILDGKDWEPVAEPVTVTFGVEE